MLSSATMPPSGRGKNCNLLKYWVWVPVIFVSSYLSGIPHQLHQKKTLPNGNNFISCYSNRAEESDEMSYMKELTSVSEPTQIQLGLL